ncbi:dUTP diphosphatase [Vagococcus lutrae]|uniref:dUTP diphosphatase n=1 Tax=Vagococcus lutrae TaxID=81947 RepID=UPI00288F9639|nr:dUTP diphosphatase [Vagococcus lutrae]MDT2844685.1 dUTP diphosphatase [Vagococcus lutrae]
MNFKKLQEMQRALDDAILKEKPEMTAEERFEKTLATLSVEIAELANTAEHFKFWKENKGKIDEKRFSRDDWFSLEDDLEYIDHKTGNELTFKQAHKLTLVEEASDCLHFILSLANQLEIELNNPFVHCSGISKELFYIRLNGSITSCFNNHLGGDFRFCQTNLEKVTFYFMNYIDSLGIDTQELEQAYYDKNEINYQRLREGY